MPDLVTTTISVIALGISSVTAWLTLFRRGTVEMTQPTVIYFGRDKARGATAGPPKIYLRALLFCTAKRGRVIESMHASLARNESSQTFNVWVHGEERLVRGSGLFVGETGVAANHHFLTPSDGSSFHFIDGVYRLDVFAKLVGDSKPKRLLTQRLEVSREAATALRGPGMGLYFDWGPESAAYLPHVKMREREPEPDELIQAVRSLAQPEQFRP